MRGNTVQDRIFWTGLEYRYIPAVARLIREVDSGFVGDVRMVTIREHRFPFLRKVGLWNRDKTKSGDTLVEKCCHFFDLMVRIASVDCFPHRVFASGGHDVNMLADTDTLDNAFVVVEFDNDGPRMLLELCMFAEASKNQEELSVVGDKGKLEAFAPAHQLGGGSHDPNFRRGSRNLPWVDRVTPPEPSKIEEVYEGAEASILSAGYHEGATFFELEAFVQAVCTRTEPEVSAADGLLATTIGVAAQKSIDSGRPIELSELLSDVTLTSLRADRQRARVRSAIGTERNTPAVQAEPTQQPATITAWSGVASKL